ncbi:serine hydrolase domain-containing protein [Alienimonas californiensis]|uniref:Esterase EstB n=1 Tax=Alienimonas californiensis TaxID=2527989 RepID=A0A517P9Y7_9PLAN|nr:serine hydrolase domain-containing protein [Alienimonas californiensis]QDT16190.1 Esterase EstB [Alienimonas californiensis]
MQDWAIDWSDDPAAVGLNPTRWARVAPLMNALCGEAAAAICVGRGRTALRPLASGLIVPGGPPATPETRFAVASLTKPIVATLVLAAVERGELSLGERVVDRLPAFGGGKKRAVRIRHLLTHTSGLPDLLPDDLELREAGAPLETFLQRAAAEPLTFEPGRAVAYSSLGFAVLWALLNDGDPDQGGRLLSDRVLEPLGMTATSLGPAGAAVGEIAAVRTPGRASAGTRVSVWNSDYWRELGAPWGGALSTAADMGRFCAAWTTGGGPVLSPAAVEAATANALAPMRQIPEEDRRCRPWGLGWRRVWPAHAAYFGDLLPPEAFGHWGSTGCVMWADPRTRRWAAILTAHPQDPEGTLCGRLSNAIVASFAAKRGHVGDALADSRRGE